MELNEIFSIISKDLGEIPKTEEPQDLQNWFKNNYEKGSFETKKAIIELFLRKLIKSSNNEEYLLWHFRALKCGHKEFAKLVRVLYYKNYGSPMLNRKIVDYMEDIAEKGDIAAMNFLGNIYAGAIHVIKNKKFAIKWYKKSANLNDPGALMRYGEMLLEEKNYDESLKCFEKSASLGTKLAYYKMSKFYKNSWGVEKDLKKSKELLKKALNKK